ncbi:hypothetical protein HNQ60_005388 [Povalibacter uvarum]|uniref:DUF6644 domain-containing protein n=1 Tax=Povalibacter uvarum TaxID=732238 RepID=A0A841HU79_9GAMM|nr:DUF6644 family protein [Povalibacter uvarum]MBB6096466.1 hypothetical protein [Povalibacter uvarum]
MISFLEMLQNTKFSEWVLVSVWGYPILLTLHSIGLALLVGLLIVIDLRALGVPKMVPFVPLRRLMTIVWAAFAVNLGSGLALFVADGVKFINSTAFLLKLSSVVIGITIAVLIKRTVLDDAVRLDEAVAEAPLKAKVLAAISILMWISAIGFGRYMAYE